MPLRGCVRIHCLPMQILLADNPSWRGAPVAITKEERPQSPIVSLNQEARERGLTEGVRYASALSLVPGLRARTVAPARIEKARGLIARLLGSYTPDVEPCPFDVDAFWVSLEGLRSLFGTEAHWMAQVTEVLKSQGLSSRIVAGFTRFGTYALARGGSRRTSFASREEERAVVQKSSVDLLPFPPRIRAVLRRLEIRTMGQLVRLPAGETLRRLGKEAAELRAAILSDDPLPIQPLALKEPAESFRRLDAPLSDTALLLPHIEELLVREAQRAESERSVIAGVTLMLHTEDGDDISDLVRPAVPTRSTAVLMRLIRLRLSERRLSSGVDRIHVRCAHTHPSRRQEELFTSPGRDLAAGARAFAAIRARFGEEAVAVALPCSSHLPEGSFRWAAMERPVFPARPGLSTAPPAAVRRILFSASPWPAARQVRRGSAHDLLVSVRWWGDPATVAPVQRAYRFQQTREGMAWIYEDRIAGTSWLQGVVD